MDNKETDAERRWWQALLVFNVVLYTVFIIDHFNILG